MVTTQRPKASDKQAALKKLLVLLKKQFKGNPTAQARSVLEHMLYAVCLEDCLEAEAQATCDRVLAAFHDLNEIRVSSISELAIHFDGHVDGERKAARFRSILQYVFEKQYAFDFEPLKKKTLELAIKQLKKIRDLSPFVRYYTLQEALGNHFVPLDGSQTAACIWLGLLETTDTPETAAESLKPAVRKSETAQVCYLLRQLAVDPAFRKEIAAAVKSGPPEGFDLATSPNRLQDLLSGKTSRKPADRKPAKPAVAQKKSTPGSKKVVPKKTGVKSTAGAKKKKKTKNT